MTRRTQSVFARPITLCVLAGATLSLAALSGCGDSDDAQAAVKQAGRSFTSIAVGDANSNPTYSEQSYRDTEQALAEYAGSEDGYAEAAAVGVAMAKRGQAALASQKAAQAERESMLQGRVIRGMINEWLTMDAIAQAAGEFDPSEDISELEGIIELRKDDIASYQSSMERIEAEISDYESEIAQLRERASEQRNQAGALELQMPRVSAQEAAKIAAQVREFTLRSDQYALEAQRLDGIVGQLRPGAREVGLNVEKARLQIELLENATQELRDRAQASQADAQQAQQDAQAAQRRINEAVNDFQDLRDGQVVSANERAISLARSAITALRDANDAVKQSATLNKADTQQLLAELTSRQAGGEREEAMLYMALLDAKVTGDWQSMIDAAQQKADELEAETKQAYLDAASSLRSARIRGDVADRIEAAAVRLERLGGLEPELEETDGMDDMTDMDGNDEESIDEEMTDEPLDDEG